LKRNLKIALIVLLIGAGIAGYQVYDFRSEELPRLEAARKKKNDEVNAKLDELRKLQSFAQNIESVKQELKELNLQLESLLEYMPRTFNLSALLRKLTMLAQNSGVKLHTFRPAKGEEKGPEGFYSMTTIGFDLKGSFTQTLIFLDQLSRLKRIVNVQSLRMTADAGDQSSNALGAVGAVTQCAVKTYRFSE
jgi:type IV pilus assembly protein PilO